MIEFLIGGISPGAGYVVQPHGDGSLAVAVGTLIGYGLCLVAGLIFAIWRFIKWLFRL